MGQGYWIKKKDFLITSHPRAAESSRVSEKDGTEFLISFLQGLSTHIVPQAARKCCEIIQNGRCTKVKSTYRHKNSDLLFLKEELYLT